jgi:hypothetical protein
VRLVGGRHRAPEAFREIRIAVAAGDARDETRFEPLAHPVLQVDAEESRSGVVYAGLGIEPALARRALADIIDQSAGIAAAIEDRGRAAQDLDALQCEAVDEEAAETVAVELQAVLVDAGLRRFEAADIDPVRVAIGTEWLREDAGRIAQRLVRLRSPEIVDLLAADHGDGLRDFRRRRGGLRAGRGALCHIAFDGPGRGALRFTLHLDALELRGPALFLRKRAMREDDHGGASQKSQPRCT